MAYPGITVERFFDLFIEELKSHPSLWSYYKFHTDTKSFSFRKAYFCQRLQYIAEAVTRKDSQTWDIGCGYGTTAIFLALNGYKVHGTTLEFYYKEIPQRLQYWSKVGDISGFSYDYEDLFDESASHGMYDYIIVQDTLHHLEPIDKALQIMSRHLKPDGSMVVIEENGNNIIQSFKLYLQRGNKRIIEIYDERLKKNILLGNENIRPLSAWKEVMARNGFRVDESSVQYIRALPPFLFNRNSYEESIRKEQGLWKNNRMAKEYFFFGINYIAKPAAISSDRPVVSGKTGAKA